VAPDAILQDRSTSPDYYSTQPQRRAHNWLQLEFSPSILQLRSGTGDVRPAATEEATDEP
jgi:hypothetical protein